MILGVLYNGQNSKAEPSAIDFVDSYIHLTRDNDEKFSFSIKDTQISSRIAQVPRKIVFPNGWIFETALNDEIDEYVTRGGLGRFIHKIETNWIAALSLTIIFLVIGFSFYFLGLPFLAKTFAPKIPDRALEIATRQTLQFLEKAKYSKPSQLPEKEAQMLKSLTSSLEEKYPELHLKFVKISSPAIGANAFALPDNEIVVTDELVNLAKNEDEIRAVLLHEIGHAYYHHAAEFMIENSALSLFLTIALGDSSVSTIPLVLMSSSYSRTKERAADAFAAQELKKIGLSPSLLASLLEKLENQHHEKHGQIPEFLSSHPDTAARVKYLREN
jgi:Zn-dependent protease with chaperone function